MCKVWKEYRCVYGGGGCVKCGRSVGMCEECRDLCGGVWRWRVCKCGRSVGVCMEVEGV